MTALQPAQLPLGLALREDASFAGFWAGPNAEVVAALETQPAMPGIYLHGAAASGKTHLLQAVCRAALAAGQQAIYLPLDGLETPAAIRDVPGLSVVCIDRLDAITTAPVDALAWETALYDLMNQCRSRQVPVVVADRSGADRLTLQLPDLRSRLMGLTLMQLRELLDDDKARLLRRQAQQRGMELSPEAARYLLTHGERSVPGLLSQIETLDRAALAAQRRLTLPFIRQVLFKS